MKIVYNSFQLAKENPKIFLPKLISVSLSSLWILGILNSYGKVEYYLVTLPLIIYVNFFTSVLVAKMTKNPNKSLIKSTRDIYDIKIKIGTILMFLLILTGLASLPVLIGIYTIFSTELFLLGLLAALIGLIILISMGFLLYFLPIAVVENKNLRKIIQSSKNTSLGHSKEVVAIFSFSLLLLGFGLTSEGLLRGLSYLGFILGRLIESIVTTYVFVISSRFYLEKKN